MTEDAAPRLLVLCAREPDGAWLDSVRAVASAVRDWKRVAELATAHGVLGYVRGALAQADVVVPGETAAQMRDTEMAEVAGVLQLDAVMARVLSLLREQGIDALVLKGPVLARRLYPEPSLRPYHDIDLVVRRTALARAKAALLGAGLVEIPYEAEEARAAAQLWGAEEPFHLTFVTPRSAALVELHADPLQLGLLPAAEDERWQRAIDVKELGTGVRALCDEDQVVQLSVHAHKHGFSRLIWLKDLDLLIRGRGAVIDWALVEDVASREGVRASIWYSLSLATALLETPPTPAVRFRPSLPVRLLYERLWPRAGVAALDTTMRRRAVQFHVAEAWRGMVPTVFLMGRRRERLRLLARSIRARRPGA